MSTLKKRARYSQTTASIAPVWIAMLKTFQRSPVAPIRSAATIRCPVLAIGRNSVSPSTMPRISACSSGASATQKLLYCRPETRRAVGCIVAGATEQDPALRSAPGGEQPLGMLGRDHVVALGNEAQERRFHLRSDADRIEPMLQHPVDRQVPVVALRDRGKAVVWRHEDHPAQRPMRRELHGDPAPQAAAES